MGHRMSDGLTRITNCELRPLRQTLSGSYLSGGCMFISSDKFSCEGRFSSSEHLFIQPQRVGQSWISLQQQMESRQINNVPLSPLTTITLQVSVNSAQHRMEVSFVWDREAGRGRETSDFVEVVSMIMYFYVCRVLRLRVTL